MVEAVLRLERRSGPDRVGGPQRCLLRRGGELNRGTRRVTGAVESVSKRGLHLLNLPAGTDIRQVREQLARMDRRLVQISKELEQLEGERV